jgi:hypothetical protein
MSIDEMPSPRIRGDGDLQIVVLGGHHDPRPDLGRRTM